MSVRAQNTRQERLRKTKAELVDELEGLERQIADQAPISDRRLATAIEEIGESVVLCDADERIVFCNRVFREHNLAVVDSLKPGNLYVDFLRAAIDAGMIPDAIGQVEEWLDKRMDQLRNPTGPVELLRQGGLWILMNAQRLDDGGMMLISTDISKLKQAEEELLNARDDFEQQVVDRTRELTESQNRLRGIFDNAPVELYLKDTEGRYVEINHRFEALFNVKNADVIGKLPEEIHDLEFGHQVREHDLNVIRRGEARTEIQTAITEFGERVIHTIKFPIFNEDGAVSGLGAVASDITEIKQAEVQMAAAKEAAESSNRAKSDFLSSMSHELRTPLNAILGFSQLLHVHSQNPLSEKQKNYLNHIMGGGEHLLELVNQILDMAKIEAGELTLSIEPVRVDDLFSDSLALISEQVEERGLNIEVDMGSNKYIKADRIRIKQVLINLLSNAIKYNGEGGSITLVCDEVPDHMLRLSVSDTGVGIAEAEQIKLFEPFNRLGRETGDIEGTGIGLFIAKQLVEAMGGRTGFESQIGKGSTFWVEIPAADATEVEMAMGTSAISDSEEPSAADVTILYVEDNPSNLELMEAILDKLDGLKLISAHNAELGLAMAEEQRPALILMDINLPGMDGLAAMKVLSAMDKTNDIPVIAISAAAMKSDIEKGMAAGFTDYLTKPLDVDKLINVVKNGLGV